VCQDPARGAYPGLALPPHNFPQTIDPGGTERFRSTGPKGLIGVGRFSVRQKTNGRPIHRTSTRSSTTGAVDVGSNTLTIWGTPAKESAPPVGSSTLKPFDYRWLWLLAPILMVVAWFVYIEALFWCALLASLIALYAIVRQRRSATNQETGASHEHR
jgi:hypothetical protein